MTLLFRFVLYLVLLKILDFGSVVVPEGIMHNDAPDAETLDWVDWRWIFMQVITCSSVAREPGPKSMLLTTPKPAGGLQGCLKQGSVKETSFVWDSLRLVGPGSACWNRLCSSRHTWRSPPRILE